MKKNELRHPIRSKRILLGLCLLAQSSLIALAEKPNVIVIYADDMGIGDVSHTTGLAATPHIDRMAAEGMRFTDAHLSSAVCTPSCCAILSGIHPARVQRIK